MKNKRQQKLGSQRKKLVCKHCSGQSKPTRRVVQGYTTSYMFIGFLTLVAALNVLELDSDGIYELVFEYLFIELRKILH
jgi:hypothetical protein